MVSSQKGETDDYFGGHRDSELDGRFVSKLLVKRYNSAETKVSVENID
jgi:hypothetical protein